VASAHRQNRRSQQHRDEHRQEEDHEGTVIRAGMRALFLDFEARVWRNSWLRTRSALASGVPYFSV
jgi:hypothetical protein